MSSVRFGFRWYGPQDTIPLDYIRQIPCVSEIVTACYDVPSGEIWPRENILTRVRAAEENGLSFSVAEGLPVHESIKLARPERERYLDAYCENISRLSEAGVKIICYNFMPLFGWLRTDLSHRLADGSHTLAFSMREIEKLDLEHGDFSLPGWHFSASLEERRQMLLEYREMGCEGLKENLRYFLKRVMPHAQACGVRMAIHPDDPPIPVFGLPRVVSTAQDLRWMREVCGLESNGITLCVGSLASAAGNDVLSMAEEFAPYIPFVHARNVARTQSGEFYETAHLSSCGEVDMAALLKALHRGGFDGVIRADHGRMIFGETGKPGYGLYDRALGVSYLAGIWEAVNACLTMDLSQGDLR